MKNNNSTSIIVFIGIFVVMIFVGVITLNMLPNYESNSYYVKVGDDMSAKIESVSINDGRLILTTSGNAIEYCVKSTRSTPNDNSLCWNKVENNKASISVFEHKKYYVWIKDENGNISNYLSVNSNDEG